MLDVVAVVPWRVVARYATTSYFRAATLRRFNYLSLFKLCRVSRLVEFERNWRAAIGSLKHKDRIIIKYLVGLVLLVHYEACGIRFAHDVQTKRGDKDTDTVITQRGHYGTPLLDRDGQAGVWTEYAICLDWALSTLLAESSYVTAGECGLSVANMLFGLLFMSYLIADLTNTLCNTDPAANDFKMTSDTLRDFLEENKVPPAAIDSVREYLEASEGLFRVKFNYQLLHKLSPQLQNAVSQWLLGAQCARLPFLMSAPRRAAPRARPRGAPRAGTASSASSRSARARTPGSPRGRTRRGRGSRRGP